MECNRLGTLGAAAASALVCLACFPAAGADRHEPVQDSLPQFTKDGALIKPTGWDAWVMVGSSIGLSYNAAAAEAAPSEAPGMFHNVYVQPWAYREFVAREAFPERTMFVLAFYEPSRKSTPARAGFYEGDRLPSLEVHVKRAGLDSSGWAFFGFGNGDRTAAKLPGGEACYSCHAKEAAYDNVFTQFYPALRERLAGATDAP